MQRSCAFGRTRHKLPAALVLASRLNLLGNSRACTNGGCDVWGRENEETVVGVFRLDTRAGHRLVRVDPIADYPGNRPGRCSGREGRTHPDPDPRTQHSPPHFRTDPYT